MSASGESLREMECPVCGISYTGDRIQQHVNDCLSAMEVTAPVPAPADNTQTRLQKRSRLAENTTSPSAEPDTSKKRKTSDDSLQNVKQSPTKSPISSFFAKRQPKNSETSKTLAMGSSHSTFSTSKSDTPTKTDTPHSSQACKTDKLQSSESTDTETTETLLSSGVPLAERMRPKTLEEYIGQEQAIGKKTMLHSLLQKNNIPSMVLWGPPGCGKTTLARIVSEQCKLAGGRFVKLSATTSGVAEVKEVIKVARNEQKLSKRRTTLFVDEIHRFNKLQQDSFLPHIESGVIVFIGATTENPSFQVNNALLSRCKVVVLEKHSPEAVEAILRRTLEKLHVTQIDGDAEEQKEGVCIERDAVSRLAFLCDGDARIALNGLETALRAAVSKVTKANVKVVTAEDIKKGLERSHVQYDRAGEEHYNCASALQKSIRGGSADGALYWMARMLEGGEDPLFIARRLVVCASEDIGLADPQALPLAVATFQACHFLGKGECPINLAHCCTYLARAPKSNETFMAYRAAKACIQQHEGPLPGVPLHLRNAPTRLMKDFGYGSGYKYSHDYKDDKEGGRQEYLPKELQGTSFFKQQHS